MISYCCPNVQFFFSPQVSSDLNHPIYPSTLVSPLDHTPSPAVTSPTTPLSSGTFAPNGCLELPLPQGRLEPGMGVKAHLIMQGASLSLERDTEIPWNIVFYYEPALISANSRLRSEYEGCCASLAVRAQNNVWVALASDKKLVKFPMDCLEKVYCLTLFRGRGNSLNCVCPPLFLPWEKIVRLFYSSFCMVGGVLTLSFFTSLSPPAVTVCFATAVCYM